MHTLHNLLSECQTIDTSSKVLEEIIPRYGAKPRMVVPGEGNLLLPRGPDGLNAAINSPSPPSELADSLRSFGRITLLYEPTFVLPLVAPRSEELRQLGVRPDNFRNEHPRALCTGVVARTPNGDVFNGIARIIALENGIRMGRTSILSIEDLWSKEPETVEDGLARLVQEAKDSVLIGPEPTGKKWRTLLALLGGRDEPALLPPDWKRRMQLVAGLYQVRLDIRPHPETARSEIIAELKTRPPEALLVWADWVAHPEPFIAAYTKARPDGYADTLGRSDRSMVYSEHIAELQMHLRQLVAPDELPAAPIENWTDAKKLILELRGPHFQLTARAVEMLDGNPYPKIDRMVAHLKSLAGLAAELHRRHGNLGRRISDVAIENYGIEIALFDSSLADKSIEYEGRTFNTQVHVKVDDYKSPEAVGRIYFAIDSEGARLIVDHIGLHNY